MAPARNLRARKSEDQKPERDQTHSSGKISKVKKPAKMRTRCNLRVGPCFKCAGLPSDTPMRLDLLPNPLINKIVDCLPYDGVWRMSATCRRLRPVMQYIMEKTGTYSPQEMFQYFKEKNSIEVFSHYHTELTTNPHSARLTISYLKFMKGFPEALAAFKLQPLHIFLTILDGGATVKCKEQGWRKVNDVVEWSDWDLGWELLCPVRMPLEDACRYVESLAPFYKVERLVVKDYSDLECFDLRLEIEVERIVEICSTKPRSVTSLMKGLKFPNGKLEKLEIYSDHRPQVGVYETATRENRPPFLLSRLEPQEMKEYDDLTEILRVKPEFLRMKNCRVHVKNIVLLMELPASQVELYGSQSDFEAFEVELFEYINMFKVPDPDIDTVFNRISIPLELKAWFENAQINRKAELKESEFCPDVVVPDYDGDSFYYYLITSAIDIYMSGKLRDGVWGVSICRHFNSDGILNFWLLYGRIKERKCTMFCRLPGTASHIQHEDWKCPVFRLNPDAFTIIKDWEWKENAYRLENTDSHDSDLKFFERVWELRHGPRRLAESDSDDDSVY